MMKIVKFIGTYIVVGAATAIGCKIANTLSDSYERTVIKQKIKKKFKS
jgi:hypothetical protein